MGKRKVPLTSLEEKENKVPKLSAFEFITARSSELKTVDTPSNSDVLPQCGTPSKGTRKFLQSWQCSRPWLRYESKENLMYCDICINAFVKNTFTVGCSILKKECITKHEKSNGRLCFKIISRFLLLLYALHCYKPLSKIYSNAFTQNIIGP